MESLHEIVLVFAAQIFFLYKNVFKFENLARDCKFMFERTTSTSI